MVNYKTAKYIETSLAIWALAGTKVGIEISFWNLNFSHISRNLFLKDELFKITILDFAFNRSLSSFCSNDCFYYCCSFFKKIYF